MRPHAYTRLNILQLNMIATLQEPRLRRVHARTQTAIKLDPERPEYHRASLHWHRQALTSQYLNSLL